MSSYNKEFYETRRLNTEATARLVLSELARYFPLTSVVDIGCGTGTWLAVAKELGAESVQGMEGIWVTDELLDISLNEIERCDLRQRLHITEEFDAAISLEVAEHLPPSRSATFVEDLVQLADRVVFSAAIPGQGGIDHTNEQPQSFWIREFSKFDFVAYDVFRPILWGKDDIPFWYQQNMFLFVRRGKETEDLVRAAAHRFVSDVIHPKVVPRLQRPPTLKQKIQYMSQIPHDVFRHLIGRIP